MLQAGIATKTIAVIEDQYCSSILQKKEFLQIEKFDLCENEEIIEKYIIKLANTIKVFFEVAGSV